MVQKIPREEQLRRELEIIDETIKVRDRLLEEKVRIEATLPRHTIDYQIQMATVRLGINAAEQHIKAALASYDTICAAMEREGKNELSETDRP